MENWCGGTWGSGGLVFLFSFTLVRVLCVNSGGVEVELEVVEFWRWWLWNQIKDKTGTGGDHNIGRCELARLWSWI